LAYGIAVIYAIEVVLLAIVIGLMLTSTAGTSDSAGPDSSILNLFVILYFLTLLSGDPSGGVVQIWIAGFVILLILPVVVALVFSIWAATRRRHTTTA
jgi:predicted Kef-type K+ transport protein